MGDAHKEGVWNELRALYHDGSSYGGLTQLDHALQTALQAREFGGDDAVVVAALLHDCGWNVGIRARIRSV